MNIVKSVLVFTLVPSVVLAVPYPELYQNQHYQKVGPERAKRDIMECRIAAEDYEAANKTRGKGVKSALKGSVKGAAMGALGASIMKQGAGRGAGAGAALGGLSSAAASAKESREGSPEYRNFMEACLEDRGYKVIGWKNR